MVFLKELFKEEDLKKKSADYKKHEKLPSRQSSDKSLPDTGRIQCSDYGIFYHTSPIEPTVTNCDISDNNSQLKCVIADVTGK